MTTQTDRPWLWRSLNLALTWSVLVAWSPSPSVAAVAAVPATGDAFAVSSRLANAPTVTVDPALGTLDTTFRFTVRGAAPNERLTAERLVLSLPEEFATIPNRTWQLTADGAGNASFYADQAGNLNFGPNLIRVRSASGQTSEVTYRIVSPEESAQPTTGENGSPAVTALRRGIYALQSRYYAPVESAPLFLAGTERVNAELARRGSPARLEPIGVSGNGAVDRGAFVQAFAGLVTQEAVGDAMSLAVAALSGMGESFGEGHTYFADAARQLTDRRSRTGRTRLPGVGFRGYLSSSAGQQVAWEVLPGTPAERAGLQAGDAIMAINGRPVDRFDSINELPIGEPFTLTVTRRDRPEGVTVTLAREAYDVPPWEERVLDGGIGYLRVRAFASTMTPAALAEIARRWSGQGLRGIVVDVRQNGGGNFEALQALLGALVGPGQPLLTHEYRYERPPERLGSTGDAWANRPPTAFLVNEFSGSAAEFAPAIAQDYRAARVFGSTTRGLFGCTYLYSLGDASAMAINECRTTTFGGQTVRGGIAPDEVVEGTGDDLFEGRDPQLDAARRWIAAQPASVAAVPAATATVGGAAPSAPACTPLQFGSAVDNGRLIDEATQFGNATQIAAFSTCTGMRQGLPYGMVWSNNGRVVQDRRSEYKWSAAASSSWLWNSLTASGGARVPAGAWDVVLYVDGRDVARGTFSVR